MKYWLDIKNNVANNVEVAGQLLLLTLGVYSFVLAEDDRLLKVPVLFAGLLAWFFFRNKMKHPIIWIVFFTLLIIDLFQSYLLLANHHFMLMFMVLSFIIYCYHKREDYLLKNVQILFVVVLMASAVQKLTSSQFVNGDFYYYMFNRGSIFREFLNLFPESLEIAKSNSDNLFDLQSKDPNLKETIVLNDIFPNLGMFSLIFAWVTIIIEFIVAIAVLWKPKSKWTHLCLVIMILGILFTRLETGFMALLAISGLFLCKNLKLKLLYVSIVVGCITLMVTRLGSH